MSAVTNGPKVSIVVSVLNGAETLERCLSSVFDQTYADRELVVIDGGSTDGTLRILEKHASRIHYWKSERDCGVYDAWNRALDHVTGEWICFLGADDRFCEPDSLERMARELARVGDTFRVVYAGVHVVEADGAIRLTVGRPWAQARVDFRHRMSIPHQATFHHRSLFERHGRFDASFRICGDYELLLRELLHHEAHFVPGLVVVAMGTGGISDHVGTAVTMTREFERARHRHGLTRLPPPLSFRLFRARCHHWLTRLAGRRAADSVSNVYRSLAGRPRT